MILTVTSRMELYKSTKLVQSDFRNVKPVFVGVNLLLYTFFCVVLIVWGTLPSEDHYSTECGQKVEDTTYSTKDIVSIVYKVIVAILSLIVSLLSYSLSCIPSLLVQLA